MPGYGEALAVGCRGRRALPRQNSEHGDWQRAPRIVHGSPTATASLSQLGILLQNHQVHVQSCKYCVLSRSLVVPGSY